MSSKKLKIANILRFPKYQKIVILIKLYLDILVLQLIFNTSVLSGIWGARGRGRGGRGRPGAVQKLIYSGM